MRDHHLVIVLGMHRSGTSAITKGLEALGVDLGQNLMPGVEDDNDKGYFEDLDVNALNMELMSALGHDWNTSTPLSPQELTDSPVIQELLLRGVVLLRNKLRDSTCYGLKDPRIARLLPFWQRAFELVECRVSYVIAHRNPLSVARSLSKRDGMASEKAHYLWFEHMLLSLTLTRGAPRMVVDFDRVMKDPAGQLQRIAEGLGLSFDPNAPATINYREQFLEKRLQHHRYGKSDLALNDAANSIIIELNDLLSDLAGDVKSLDSEEVESLLTRADRQLTDDQPKLNYIKRVEKELIEAHQEVADRDGRIAAFTGQVASLEQAINERDIQIASLHDLVTERDAQVTDLQDLMAERAEQVAFLGTAIDERDLKIRELSSDVELTSARLSALMNSRSWRVTAPLRRLRSRLNQVRKACRLFSDYSAKHGLFSACKHSVVVVKRGFKDTLQEGALTSGNNSTDDGMASVDMIEGGEIASINKANRKRVIFVSGESDTPGHRYRVASLAALLSPLRYEVLVYDVGDIESIQSAFQDSSPYCIWFWRCCLTDPLRSIVEIARLLGTVVHYDVDDLMIDASLADEKHIDGIRSMNINPDDVRRMYLGQRALLAESDQASSPTLPLTRELMSLQPKSYVIPNGFDSADIVKARKARQQKKDDGLIRIGYASGSRTHQKDFGKIVPALVHVLQKYKQVRLVIYPDTLLLEEFPDLAAYADQIEERPMVPVEELVYEYALYDVNLCPLEEGARFCEAKSELKFFEAALSMTPTIASPTTPYRMCITHGKNGFLASSIEEWKASLEVLLESPATRRQIGLEAYHSVLWHFGPERRRWLLEHALESAKAHSYVSDQLYACYTAKHRSPKIALSHNAREVDVLFERSHHAESSVTVIMPLYNYQAYVTEALDSLLQQTLKPIDLVVVDDGSTDDSVEVVLRWMQDHHERFGACTLMRNRRNVKLGATRNVGVTLCETEIYFPMDPDNKLDQGCLENCLAAMERECVSVIYPRLIVFGGARIMPDTQPWLPHKFASGNYVDAMAMVKKSVWLHVGGYSENPDLLGWEDYDFWCRLLREGFRGALADEAVAHYRAHNKSMLSTISDQQDNKTRMINIMRENYPWLTV